MNENRTHLLRPCAATALLTELSVNNSRARSSAANDEPVAAGIQVEGGLPGFPTSPAAGSLARSWSRAPPRAEAYPRAGHSRRLNPPVSSRLCDVVGAVAEPEGGAAQVLEAAIDRRCPEYRPQPARSLACCHPGRIAVYSSARSRGRIRPMPPGRSAADSTGATAEETLVHIRRHMFGTVLAAGVSALAVGLGGTPVAAATVTWTVTPGGTFETPAAAHFSYLTDTATGTVFSCNGLSVAGTFKSGSGVTNPIGKIGFGPLVCGGPAGIELGITFSNPHMGIRAVRYDASTSIVYGAITHISATISPDSGAACTATIDGTGPALGNGMTRFKFYNNAGQLQTLRRGGNLHAYNVTGCGGLINNGDVLTYGSHVNIVAPGHFAVNAITSP